MQLFFFFYIKIIWEKLSYLHKYHLARKAEFYNTIIFKKNYSFTFLILFQTSILDIEISILKRLMGQNLVGTWCKVFWEALRFFTEFVHGNNHLHVSVNCKPGPLHLDILLRHSHKMGITCFV